MRPIGLLLVLAIAAVLHGAPSTVSGADGTVAARHAGHSTAAPNAGSAQAPTGPAFAPAEIAIGVGGIAALVLLACYGLISRRRRGIGTRSEEAREHAPPFRTADEMATAALHRRTLRRAQVRLEEDPILASMGVGSAKRATKPGVSRARRAARRSPPT